MTRSYFDGLDAVLGPVVRDVFGLQNGASLLAAYFSIVTTPAENLSLVQRIPHFDALESGRLAIIHYLSPTDHGGTAFYRHRSTGYETLDFSREAAYFTNLKQDMVQHGQPLPAYINGSTPLFECTARFDPCYNRALIYRSCLLHSGAILKDQILPSGTASGRLTVTSFLAAK